MKDEYGVETKKGNLKNSVRRGTRSNVTSSIRNVTLSLKTEPEAR
jgi:hypothetical protein